MRTLLLMRGAPGCGKSTFIEKNNLKKFTLCADEIRILIQSPEMLLNGNFGISQKNDTKVWSILFEILEDRMSRGEFTVIDATNSKTKEMTRYRELAKAYRYRIYCVDFTDLPLEECKKRNNQRLEYKQVPEEVIENCYKRFEGQKIPSGITVIKPDELNKILIEPLDVSEYKKIHYIGDIHGCYTALKEGIGDIKEDELYVFTGDYIDRGIENAEVLNFLISICENPNICLLEGNHDRAIYDYAHDIKTNKKEFDTVTAYELQKANIDKRKLRILYQRIRQCAYYKYNDKFIFACHAGISKMPENLLYLSTQQMIKGIGAYSEMREVAEFWKEKNPNIIQIFGHRNIEDSDIKINECVYNLEGAVEFGGYLRIVTINQDGNIETKEIKNNIVTENNNIISEEEKNNMDIDNLIQRMRENNYIRERKFDNISSFNFTEGAFRKGVWDGMTTKARGLFINTVTKKIVARSYDKFFRINENYETQPIFLKSKFQYPLNVFVKYNGSLGIIGYDEETDNLIIASKSSLESEHSSRLKFILSKKGVDLEELKKYLKENNSSMVFEVIDPKYDPHIIKYDKEDIILLDIIKNDFIFNKIKYNELVKIGEKFNFKVKELAYTLNSTKEFWDWYYDVQEPDYKYKDEYIEGFVIEDSNNFLVKIKLDYYNNWKFMRSVFQEVLRQGYVGRTSKLTSEFHNDFYNWCRNNRDNLPNNIIEARDMYYESKCNE